MKENKKEIILGVFHSVWYDKLPEEYGWIKYWNFETYYRVWGPITQMIDGIYPQIDRINFLLDEIRLPLDTHYSVTCKELNHIIKGNYIKKTRFWLNGKIVPKKKVVKLIKQVKDNTLSFGNIDFKTI